MAFKSRWSVQPNVINSSSQIGDLGSQQIPLQLLVERDEFVLAESEIWGSDPDAPCSRSGMNSTSQIEDLGSHSLPNTKTNSY